LLQLKQDIVRLKNNTVVVQVSLVYPDSRVAGQQSEIKSRG